MFTKFSKFRALGLISIFVSVLTLEECQAQNISNNNQLRTTESLFRTTPSQKISLQESTVLEQAIQDKIQTEYKNNDQYDQDFKWAAQMHERGLLDSEQIRAIAKNRAASRARETFEVMIDGSDVERSYRDLERGLRKFKDGSTVEFGKKADGRLFAHKLKSDLPAKIEDPFAVFYLQPDLNSGVSAVIDTKNNLRMEYQPTKDRLLFGYRINF